MDKNNPPAKKALGRGLGALIVNTELHPPDESNIASTSAAAVRGVHPLSLDAIRPNPQQPRIHFEETALQELAASIHAHGLIQPLIVTKHPTEPGAYWLVAGERRWRAARLAGLSEAPALVREASPQQLVELALIENIQRADLNALEEAAAYRTLREEFKLTHDEIADRVGKSRSAVTNTLRLLELPPAVQTALVNQQISAGHARALLALRDASSMQQVLQHIIDKALSVRQTEAFVTQLVTSKAAAPMPEKSAETAAAEQLAYLENRFRTALGTRVQLNRNANGSGRLVVHFYNDEDLTQLYNLIAGHDEVD